MSRLCKVGPLLTQFLLRKILLIQFCFKWRVSRGICISWVNYLAPLCSRRRCSCWKVVKAMYVDKLFRTRRLLLHYRRNLQFLSNNYQYFCILNLWKYSSNVWLRARSRSLICLFLFSCCCYSSSSSTISQFTNSDW